MKILITYGRQPPYPPFGVHLVKAFRTLGHTAMLLPVRDHPWRATAMKRFMPQSWKNRWGWDQVEWVNHEVLRAVGRYRPDLLIEVEGDLLMSSTLQTIKSRYGVRLGLCLVEGPIQKAPSPELAEYERIVSTSLVAVEQLRHAGFPSVDYLPFATDPAWFRPSSKGGSNQVHPLGFIGAYSPRRAQWLSSVVDLGLNLWGSDWDARCSAAPLRKVLRSPRGVFGRDLVHCYQTTKTFISLQREHMMFRDASGQLVGTGLGWRHFDVPACGSLLVSEWVLELQMAFEVAQEVETFSSPEELRDKTRYLLSHEARRQAMVRRARQRVLKEHTYVHRARKWVGWYERLPKRRSHLVVPSLCHG